MTQNADKTTERPEIPTSAEALGKARRPRRMAREPNVASEPRCRRTRTAEGACTPRRKQNRQRHRDGEARGGRDAG